MFPTPFENTLVIILIAMNGTYDTTMTRRYQLLVLVFLVLTYSCIAGCTSTGNIYGNTPSPVTTPKVSLNPLSDSAILPVLTSVPQVTASAFSGSNRTVIVELTAAKMAFDQSSITVPAGASVVVNFHNREAPGSSQVTGISHNFAVYDSSSAKEKIFSGEIITGGEDATYRFSAPAIPGTYFFRCDVHPSAMTGTFIVR
jgi:plastocyanin